METIQKNDFVEVEFTGVANNEIFDTTNKEEAKSIGLEADVKPVIVCVGNDMLLKGFDKALLDKEIGKKYSVTLTSKEAFGARNPSMIKTMPIKIFHEKNMNPYQGMTLQMDNYLAKVISVSGGRVIVDFNNPLAGKDVTYNFLILRKVEDKNEKINALQEFFFRMKFDYTLENNKVIFNKPEIKPFVEIYKAKFKSMTGLDFEVVEKPKEKKEEKKDEKIEKDKKDEKELNKK